MPDGSAMPDGADPEPGTNNIPTPVAIAAEAVPVTATATNVSDTVLGIGRGSAIDRTGNYYVADSTTNRVAKVAPDGTVTTILDLDNGQSLGFGVTVDSDSNVYVGAYGSIVKVAPGGAGTEFAAFSGRAVGLDIDGSGTIYVADTTNRRVLRVSREGVVTTLVDLDPAFRLYDLAVDRAGKNVYLAYADDNRVYKVTGSPPVVSVFAGSGTAALVDGTGVGASFSYPTGLAVDDSGNVYVADNHNVRIRRVTPNGVVTTVKSSNGTLWDVAVDGSKNLYFGVRRIRKLIQTGVGELKVTWQAPASDSTSTGYVATAVAPGQDRQTCSSSGDMTCTLHRLVSGVAYEITVAAVTAAGTGKASAPISATPN